VSKPFRPMLAADITDELDKLRFPVYATPKLDGVRALVFPDGVYSRSMKLIPNKHVQKLFGCPEFVGLDGELIVGAPTDKDVYRRTQSVVARHDDDTPVTFYVFDFPHADYLTGTYEQRLSALRRVTNTCGVDVRVVPAVRCGTLEQLLNSEQLYLADGYEGLILRSPEGRYKNGRSTVKEQGMLKLKRFVDGEAEIIGIEEELHNGNEAKESALGLTERSSHKAGLVGKGRMGALIVRDLKTGVEFRIGTGFTAEDRVAFWNAYKDGPGFEGYAQLKYKHFAHGAKDKPRHPTYVGMREGWDL
jgi:DNA ligase 1